MKLHAVIVFLALLPLLVVAQHNNRRDSSYWRTVNKTKSGFWGNSFQFSPGINFSRTRELELNVGRANGTVTRSRRGLGDIQVTTWGFGYAMSRAGGVRTHSAKVFYEYNFFPFILIGNFAARGEYIYNFTAAQHYLRPSAGITFIHGNLLYNYSFLMNGKRTENIYRHGLALRINLFLRRSNWQENIFEPAH